MANTWSFERTFVDYDEKRIKWLQCRFHQDNQDVHRIFLLEEMIGPLNFPRGNKTIAILCFGELFDIAEDETRNYSIVKDLKEFMDTENMKEIGTHAVWSVSSCKQGYGVNLLRDNNLETYWQSDGVQPHMVNVQFRQKTSVHGVGVYTDFKADESYTPSKLSVRIGNDFNDLHEVEQIEISEPVGWVWIKLYDHAKDKPIRTFMVQISVLQDRCGVASRAGMLHFYLKQIGQAENHQNGRDTHMRQIKIFASTKDNASFENMISGCKLPHFTSVDMSQYSVIK